MDPYADCLSTLQESKAGYVLSNVAEVVERILTFLPTKTLFRVASVCRLWRNCARRVLRTQQRMTWLSASAGSRYEEHTLFRTLAEELENVYLLPQTSMIMVDGETFNGYEGCNRQKKARKCLEEQEEPEPAERLRRLLPQGCHILGVVTPGVVFTPSGVSGGHPQEHEQGEAGFSLLFPAMEGVQIRPFHFCKQSLTPSALESAGLVGNPDLKVVLLFVYNAFQPRGSRFLKQLLKPLAQNNALIIGGHVEKVFAPHWECCSSDGFGVAGLALSGPRIQGASVLLDQDVFSVEAAEATMQRLKAANIPERNTVGFMFACIGRGRNYYDDVHNVEADAFRKLFPGVPLFGFFGNGEIGCDRIIRDSYSLSEMDANALQHGYSTIMSLVHLG